ncbi:MAG TPA: hypothetical protein VFE19_12410 [Jatrophihabitantaceae bacterium]|nr:hypothetical protein [Jatrophihabitantaceae bacterium]
MPTVINGLPAHILLIHIVIVLVPLGALFTVLSAVWPAARAKLGFVSPLTCLIALVFVPITTHAGTWLRDHLRAQQGDNPAIDRHANLGGTFLIYALGLFIVSAGVWWLGRMFELTGTTTATRTETATATAAATKALPQWASILIAVVAVAVSAVTVWQLYRIGDSGSHAVWGGIVK